MSLSHSISLLLILTPTNGKGGTTNFSDMQQKPKISSSLPLYCSGIPLHCLGINRWVVCDSRCLKAGLSCCCVCGWGSRGTRRGVGIEGCGTGGCDVVLGGGGGGRGRWKGENVVITLLYLEAEVGCC